MCQAIGGLYSTQLALDGRLGVVQTMDVDDGGGEVKFSGHRSQSAAGEAAEFDLFFEVGEDGLDGSAAAFVAFGVGGIA